jgi:succinate dehydrogenase / fumarate reductase, membrane anchor subunit
MSLQSPLTKARGLGSAKEGVSHWWAQRVSAIALAPLSVFFVWLVWHCLGMDYQGVRSTLGQPLIAVLLISFMSALYYHGQLGLQVIVEDYVHHRASEVILLILIRFASFLFAIASVLALLRIALVP